MGCIFLVLVRLLFGGLRLLCLLILLGLFLASFGILLFLFS